MPAIPSLLDDPDSWDTLVIGGETLPGVVRVPDPETGRDFDVKKAKGKKKASISNNGDPPRKWTVEWMIDPRLHWDEVLRIWPTIQPRQEGKNLQPLEVVHPAFALHGFRTALVESIKGPSVSKGLQTFQLTLLEKEPPKPAAGVSGTGKGLSAAQADWELQKLVHELEVVEAEIAQMQAEGLGTDEVALKRFAQLQNRRQQLLGQMNKPNSSANNNF